MHHTVLKTGSSLAERYKSGSLVYDDFVTSQWRFSLQFRLHMGKRQKVRMSA
jgi:hypothetical protein